MKIWFFNHYASLPDQPTTGAYFLMKSLSKQGHEVTAFASSFNYYLRKEIRLSGIDMTKTAYDAQLKFQWVRTTPTSGRAFSRLMNMLSYMCVSFFVGLSVREKPDFIIGVCPHPFAALSAWAVARIKGAHFVYEVRDIWPESLIESGNVHQNGLIAKILFALQMFLYRQSTAITSVLPNLGTYIQSMGIPSTPFLCAPNGITIDRAELPDPESQPQADVTCFMYLGGHSKYQGLDVIIEAAHILKQRGEHRAKIVLIGDGSEKDALQARVRELGLDNVDMRDAMPRKDLRQATGEAACFIFHLKPMAVLKYGISPNKICDYMLAARPIIFACDTVHNPVNLAQCGYTIPPEDPKAMANCMVDFINLNQSAKKEMARQGLSYALQNYDTHNIAIAFSDFLETLNQRIKGKSI